MTENFYKAFEDRYRGSRELIADRLLAYMPFVEPLKQIDKQRHIIDLGCGRGEWIELLAERGFSVLGVDIDEGMLSECVSRNLPVRTEDALHSLSGLESDSQVLVTAFHLVEHIDFGDVATLVREAMRVLLPGGILILETPNPENILVGTNEFYLDPSHRKPIPPNLLRFLADYWGFERSRVLRLNPRKKLHESPMTGIRDLLEGVGLDYAIVAQKKHDDESIALLFEQAFNSDPGQTVEEIAGRIDHHANEIDASVHRLNREFDRFLTEQKQFRAEQEQFRAEQEQFRTEQLAKLHAELERAWADSAHWHAQTQALLLSYSWKVTAPLRAGLNLSQKVGKGFKSGTVRSMRAPLRLALHNPVFASRMTRFLQERLPSLHAFLRSAAVSTGLMSDSPHSPYSHQKIHSPALRTGKAVLPRQAEGHDEPIPLPEIIDRIYDKLTQETDQR